MLQVWSSINPPSAGLLLQALPCLPKHSLLSKPCRHSARSWAGTQGVKQYPDGLVRSSELGCSIVCETQQSPVGNTQRDAGLGMSVALEKGEPPLSAHHVSSMGLHGSGSGAVGEGEGHSRARWGHHRGTCRCSLPSRSLRELWQCWKAAPKPSSAPPAKGHWLCLSPHPRPCRVCRGGEIP